MWTAEQAQVAKLLARAHMRLSRNHSFSDVERNGFLVYVSNAMIAYGVSPQQLAQSMEARMIKLTTRPSPGLGTK